MATSFNARSRDRWRDRGYYVETCEHIARLPGGIVRKSDMFGFADLLAIPWDCYDEPWIWLQVTSRSNVSSRIRKVQEEVTGKGQWEVPIWKLALKLLRRGDRIVVEGWDQPGGAYTEWRVRSEEITEGMLRGER